MAAIIIRNLPEKVHKALRRLAARSDLPVEAYVRQVLSDVAQRKAGGIDFDKLMRSRAALGLYEDGPAWETSLDEPALSRRVLQAGKTKTKTRRKS